MKFKCRKRKKPSKHNEEKRMTQATEAEKEMGMEHKYWRANWIFICGTQKVQMRAGMGARGVAPPYRVRSCVFFFFFYISVHVEHSTLRCHHEHSTVTGKLSYLHLQQFYFMAGGGGPQHFCFLCSTDFRVGMWNMLIPSDYNCCIPGPRPPSHCPNIPQIVLAPIPILDSTHGVAKSTHIQINKKEQQTRSFPVWVRRALRKFRIRDHEQMELKISLLRNRLELNDIL